MAKDNDNIDQQLEAPVGIRDSSQKSFSPKVFVIGLPLFVLQLVIVYFVTANILLTKFESTPQNAEGENVESESSEGAAEVGKHIFSIDDIVVNPAGTNGQRFLMVSLAFDVPSEEKLEALKQKEFIVKDVVISILSSKTMGELNSVAQKDSLKTEISDGLVARFPEIQINSIYFSKYVVN